MLFYISLQYLIWVENQNRNFGIPKHIHWLKRTGFLGQISVCKMPNFDAVYKQRIGKGSVFFRLLRPMLPLSCYSKVWHVRRSVRSILKAKMYKFWSWNMLVKCNSCNKFVIWLFNLSPFAAKYCWVLWEELLWHLQMIRSKKQES